MSRRHGPVSPPIGGGGGGLVPGPRLPLDANTLLAYYCDEDSGSTLANSVAGNAYPLTLTGNKLLGNKGLFSFGTNAVRWPAPGNGPTTFPGTGDRAYNSAASVVLPGPCTLEALLTADDVPGQYGGVAAQVTDAGGTNGLFIAGSGSGSLQVGVIISGAYSVVTYATSLYAPRLHVAASHDGASLSLFVNGVLRGSTAASGSVGTMTKIAVGNGTGAQQPFRGIVAEVRLSNVARDATYCAAAFAAANGL